MNFQDRLKSARAMLGLKQDEMSAQSGVSYSAYQKYEMGRSLPCADALVGFMQLGINANWLLTGEGPMLLADLQAPSVDAGTHMEAELLARFRVCDDDGKSALSKLAEALANPSMKAWFDAGKAMSEAANIFDRKRT